MTRFGTGRDVQGEGRLLLASRYAGHREWPDRHRGLGAVHPIDGVQQRGCPPASCCEPVVMDTELTRDCRFRRTASKLSIRWSLTAYVCFGQSVCRAVKRWRELQMHDGKILRAKKDEGLKTKTRMEGSCLLFMSLSSSCPSRAYPLCQISASSTSRRGIS